MTIKMRISMLNELNKDELIQINGGIFGVSEWADRIIRSTVRTVADAKMWID